MLKLSNNNTQQTNAYHPCQQFKNEILNKLLTRIYFKWHFVDQNSSVEPEKSPNEYSTSYLPSIDFENCHVTVL